MTIAEKKIRSKGIKAQVSKKKRQKVNRIQSPSYKLYNIPHKEDIQTIGDDYAPNLVFIFAMGALNDDSVDFKLPFLSYEEKHFLFQTLRHLSDIKIGGESVSLFDHPPKDIEKITGKHVHPLLMRKFPLKYWGPVIYESMKLWHFGDILNKIPREYFLSTEKFIRYYKRYFLFDSQADVLDFDQMLKDFNKGLNFRLPEEGKVIYDRKGENYMIPKYLSGDIPSDGIEFLELSIYCKRSLNVNKREFSHTELEANKNFQNYDLIWCRYCNRYFVINYDFTKLDFYDKGKWIVEPPSKPTTRKKLTKVLEPARAKMPTEEKTLDVSFERIEQLNEMEPILTEIPLEIEPEEKPELKIMLPKISNREILMVFEKNSTRRHGILRSCLIKELRNVRRFFKQLERLSIPKAIEFHLNALASFLKARFDKLIITGKIKMCNPKYNKKSSNRQYDLFYISWKGRNEIYRFFEYGKCLVRSIIE